MGKVYGKLKRALKEDSVLFNDCVQIAIKKGYDIF